MTKQGKIREWLAGMVRGDCDTCEEKDCGLGEDIPCRDNYKEADKILKYLHSQDVYIAKHGFYSDLMEPLIDEGEETTACLYWHCYSCLKRNLAGLFNCGRAGTMERRECYESRDEI